MFTAMGDGYVRRQGTGTGLYNQKIIVYQRCDKECNNFLVLAWILFSIR